MKHLAVLLALMASCATPEPKPVRREGCMEQIAGPFSMELSKDRKEWIPTCDRWCRKYEGDFTKCYCKASCPCKFGK